MIWRTTILLILASYQVFGEVIQNSSEVSANSKIGKNNQVVKQEKVKGNGILGKGTPQVRSKRYDKYTTFRNLQKEFDKLPNGQKFEFLADNLKDLQESANLDELSYNYMSSTPYNKNGDINTEIKEFVGCMLFFALMTLIIYYLCYIVFDCFSGPPSLPSRDTTIIRGPSTIYPAPPPVYGDISKKPTN
uniref:Pv-fam-d protein n=1 Tax=Strongyloides papillosus TaxID=174720 RepID=A0A0N5BZ78_STREA